jgi:putative ABC transport system permease protein
VVRGLRAIDRKLLRDFRRLWAQALAIALVLAAGVSVMLMSLGMSRALDDTRAAFYERNRFADVFAQANRAPLSLMPEIRAIDGVYAAEPRIQSLVLLDLPGRVEAAQAWIQSIPDDGTPLLNVPTLRSGDWPGIEARDQVVVNEPFAEANGYAIGDTFAVLLDGQKRTVTIVGTVLSPEYVYTIGPGQMMPDNRNMGVIWMRERALAAAFDMTGAFNSVSLLLVPGTPVERVIDDLERILAPYGNDGANGRETQISHSFLDGEIKQLRTLSYILPPVFMGITVFLVNMVIGRIVALERAEIGLMKAIGYSDLTICLHYLMLAGLIAVVGVAIGWGVGTWLARAMAEMYADFFKFPYLIFAMGKDVYVLSALIAFAAAFAGSMRAALSAARLPPAVAMTPPAPPRFKRTWIDEAMAALRLSQPTVMIMRSVVRWPLRSAMTILGIALAVAVLVASNFAGDATDVIIDSAFHQQNRQDVILILGGDRPEIAVEDARRLPGVMMVEGEMFLGATIRNGPVSKDSAIQARRPGTDLSRMVDAQGRTVEPPPVGIVLSDRLAEALGVVVGDTVEVEFHSGDRGTYDIPVAALVTQYFGMGALMDLDALSALFRQAPRVTTINLQIDASRTEDFHVALKDMPSVRGTIMMTQNRRAFQDTIATNLLTTMTVFAVLGILITVGVAYNGARVQLSERARELASLRILGFSKGEVSYILVGETMLLALLAQPLGWWLGWGVVWLITNSFTSDLYAIPLILNPETYSYASLIVLGASLGAVLIVRRRLDRLDLVAVMKTRE